MHPGKPVNLDPLIKNIVLELGRGPQSRHTVVTTPALHFQPDIKGSTIVETWQQTDNRNWSGRFFERWLLKLP